METVALRGSTEVVVRRLQPQDLDRVAGLDQKIVGRNRREFFQVKLAQNLKETGIKVSLAAEIDGLFVGFLLARVYYGEFGRLEPAAVLESLGVDPGFQHRGVGQAMLLQLQVDLSGLGVERLSTEVAWEDQPLLAFFHHAGFTLAPRLCLELEIRPLP